ncbi:MAG: archaellin/type IV pilin N-terminal domain-containing protein [Nanobdellota archaeon]
MIFRSRKKGVMGIETLIIFIAMILVAGVAASVLIRTSGLLQQRALAVSNEAIARVGTGFEFVQIIGNADTTAETISEFEAMLRLAAGSDTIQLNNVGLTYVSGLESFSATLAHDHSNSYSTQEIDYIGNNSFVEVYNMDNNEEDNDKDQVKLLWNCSGNYECLQFNLSTAGGFTESLGVDLDESNTELEITDLPLEYNNDIFGYVDLNGTINGTSGTAINNSEDNQNFTLTIKNYPSICSFDLLRPENDYCITPQIGDTDTNFEPGELLLVRFKVKPDHVLETDTLYEINLIPKTGVVTTASGQSPEVFTTYKTRVWP